MITNIIKSMLILICLVLSKNGTAQGRVVINEYMPWTLNGCGATAEFVELMNFGPGPADISCYILTDGDFSVTIPANTILQPGQFYVVAGQDVIPQPCANINSTIYADLNWNTCGCTSAPIPTTGDGFFTDGGSANEQVVLLDPNLQIVDAVVRNYPVEPSSLIQPYVDGCDIPDFDLDLMSVKYETLGMSAGRGNSFARKLDGDCGWVKDPQQSASASNNTPSDVSDVTYEFSYVSAIDCNDNHGGVQVFVKKASYDDFFPMYYTLVYDANNNGLFDFNDEYQRGIDETAPDIYISGLPSGRYRLTVESVQGCSLKSFDFFILPCQPALPVTLQYFRFNQGFLQWQFNHPGSLQSVVLEGAKADQSFQILKEFEPGNTGLVVQQSPVDPEMVYYRLRLKEKNGNIKYSTVLSINSSSVLNLKAAGPNPASDRLRIQVTAPETQWLIYTVLSIDGRPLLKGQLQALAGTRILELPIHHLPPGMYQFQAQGKGLNSFRFVKH
ncbi:MAG: lamin tail domain-containing protein [Flavisolibacter sp.]